MTRTVSKEVVANATRTVSKEVVANATRSFKSLVGTGIVMSTSGYYLDPITKEAFSAETPRSREAAFVDGKFTWPTVKSSDGRDLRIANALFTEEEQKMYRAYHPSGSRKQVAAATEAAEKDFADKLGKIEACAREVLKGKKLAEMLAVIDSVKPKNKNIEAVAAMAAKMSDEEKAALKAALGL